MRELIIHQAQANYIGIFSRPVFSLWGKGPTILEGLYSAFAPFNVGFTDLRQESLSPVVSDASVTVLYGTSGNYKFKLDRIESSLSILVDEDVTRFLKMLERGAEWLYSAVVDFAFQSHLFTYYNHSSLSEGTAKDCLLDLDHFDLADFGLNLGSGIILNWLEPRFERRFQLIVDHSHTVKDGLFIQFSAYIPGDKIDWKEFEGTARKTLKDTLAKLGLCIERGG